MKIGMIVAMEKELKQLRPLFSEDQVILQKSGIATVNAALQQNGVRYNLAGQKVDASYKGVVIENGKKMMVK